MGMPDSLVVFPRHPSQPHFMDHFCAICKSVFVVKSDEVEADAVITETVTTSCGTSFSPINQQPPANVCP